MADAREGTPRRPPALVLGTAQLRTAYGVARRGAAAPTPAEAQVLLAAAAGLGVDALDTAPGYGAAEESIGLASFDGAVHTKIDPQRTPAESLDGSLRRLRRRHVEVLYLHDPDEVTRTSSPVLDAAHALVGEGVGRLGASVYEPEQFDAAVADPRIGAIQAPMNLLDRRIGPERLAAAHRADVHVYARSVLLQGLLAAPLDVVTTVPGLGPFLTRFHALAAELGRRPLELAVGWVAARPGLHGFVIGADSVPDLVEMVGVARAEPLAEDELRALAELEQPSPELCDPRRWPAATR